MQGNGISDETEKVELAVRFEDAVAAIKHEIEQYYGRLLED